MKKGFTLIELLVVIAIIGLLSSVVLASLNTSRVKGRDASRLLAAKQLMTALDLYYAKYDRYPISTGAGAGTCVNRGDYPSNWCDSRPSHTVSGHWIVDANGLNTLAEFLPVDPADPLQKDVATTWLSNSTREYFYNSDNGKWYQLVFALENANPSLSAADGVRDSSGTSIDWGATYGFSNVLTWGQSF